MEKALSPNERVILENIDEQYQWIARDEDGKLYIYNKKPHRRDSGCWFDYNGFVVFSAFNHLFKMVQWTNEEPTLIAKLLKEK